MKRPNAIACQGQWEYWVPRIGNLNTFEKQKESGFPGGMTETKMGINKSPYEPGTLSWIRKKEILKEWYRQVKQTQDRTWLATGKIWVKSAHWN